MKLALVMLLLSLALSPACADESAASTFFGKLAGEWQGTGEVSAMAADMRMTWEPVLDGRFLRLTMDNRMTGTIQWGTEAVERGRSHYRLSADALEVTDEVLTKEGTWQVFGRTRLTRETP